MSGYTSKVLRVADRIYEWRERALAAKLAKVKNLLDF
jgi:hypothetical protein